MLGELLVGLRRSFVIKGFADRGVGCQWGFILAGRAGKLPGVQSHESNTQASAHD